jgi:hypothetical protein
MSGPTAPSPSIGKRLGEASHETEWATGAGSAGYVNGGALAVTGD